MSEEIREMEKDAVVETGSKNTRKGNNLKKIVAIGVTLVTIGVGGTLLYLNIDNQTPNFTHNTTAIVRHVESESVIDEVMEITNATATEDLDELEEKVALSEKLHDLDLEKYIGGLTKFEMPETYSVDEVNTMIEQFEELAGSKKVQNSVLSSEDREFTQLALMLEAYERCVNGSLTNEAYQALVNYGIPAVKSKVLDACGFDATEVSNMKIGSGSKSYVITFVDEKTGKTYNVEAEKGNSFTSKGYVHEVIGQIYDWQNKSQKAQDTGTMYDGARNDDILAGIDSLKALTLMDCQITDKGKIEVTTKMSEVRAAEKALTVEAKK